ncbi:CHAT domain-containing protein [Microbacteriaceae bacterium VKM Ac-2855]|nr:CHAT domain-containing protein [Microbacteriaceae bacterium VKM Ac-2855]
MSTRSMSWAQFAAIRANATTLPWLARLRIDDAHPPVSVIRISMAERRGEPRTVLLRLAVDHEQLLVFSRTGAIVWLTDAGTGRHELTLAVASELDALYIASFHGRRGAMIPESETATDAGVLERHWFDGQEIGGRRVGGRRVGGRGEPSVEVEIQRAPTASMAPPPAAPPPPVPDVADVDLPQLDLPDVDLPQFDLPAVDLPQFDLPAVDHPPFDLPALEVAEAEAAPTPARRRRRPARVRGSATGAIPPEVEVDEPFEVAFTLSGPGVAPAAGAAVFAVAPDHDLEVQLLRRRNVLLEPGEPDPLRVRLPIGSRSEHYVFRARASDAGPVEIELRITQDGEHLGTIPLRGLATTTASSTAGSPVATTIDASRYPQNWLFQITDGAGNPPAGKRVLRYTLRGSDGTDASWDQILNSDGLLTRLYRDIEQVWRAIAESPATTEERHAAWTAALADRGRRMFRDLLPLEARRALWARRHELRDILLSTNETEIPWEIVLVHDPDDPDAPDEPEAVAADDGPFFLGERGLFRWLTGTVQRDTVRIDAPHAFVVAPAGGPAAAGGEAEFVTTCIRAQRIDPADVARMTAALSTAKLSLFHFAGHAMVDDQVAPPLQQLMLAEAGRYSVADLERTLPVIGRRPGPLTGATVLLNACRSGVLPTSSAGFGTVFLRAGASVFIGTLWSIGDDPAADFSRAFYGELLAAKARRRRARLGAALAAGRDAARASGDPSWLAYAVYADPATTVSVSV